MKFENYETTAEGWKRIHKSSLSINDIIGRLQAAPSPQDKLLSNVLVTEHMWLREGRPYYRVWPGVFESLQKLQFGKLFCDVCIIPHNLNTLAVSLCSPIEVEHRGIIRNASTFIMSVEPSGWFEVTINIGKRYGPKNLPDLIRWGFKIEPGKTIEEQLARSTLRQISDSCKETGIAMMRLAVGLTMLPYEPDLLRPDVLADDRGRWEAGDDELKRRLEDKARRRGKLGWEVGRGIYEKRDIAAHYRHPHFAIRHTGKGRTVPKLVHVKGAFVRRDKMTEVPTGFLDDEGAVFECHPAS